MSSDLGLLLAEVRDEWERGKVIAERAGFPVRSAGQRLAALERLGMVASAWTGDHGGVRLYRRGPNAPPLPPPEPVVSYVRAVLVDVLVYHYRKNDSSCGCGWRELGRSHLEHVANVYEQSIAGRD